MPKWTGKVASDHLIPHLQAAGDKKTGRTPGPFRHNTNGTIFILVVDDFLVHHTTAAALKHLVRSLQQHYMITVNKTASKYCGMQLDWDC